MTSPCVCESGRVRRTVHGIREVRRSRAIDREGEKGIKGGSVSVQ